MSHEDTLAQAEGLSLWRLFLVFFKIGCISWGGYMALISVVRSEIVDRHKFLDDTELMDGVALAMLLPGPVAVNVVAYVGNKMRGTIGAAICAFAVILPSFFFMLGFAVLYFTWGELVIADKALAGVLPAVAAIILNAALKMRGKALRGPLDWAVAIAAATLLLTVGGILMVVLIIVGAATIGMMRGSPEAEGTQSNESVSHATPKFGTGTAISIAFLALCLGLFLVLPQLDISSVLLQLFSVFSGMSLLLFGGGYIFIPMIQEAVVHAQAWLTTDEFAASIALGQVTPGPILISATFIGYKVAGIAGAVLATVAIFLPPAVLIIVFSNQLERISHMAYFKAAQAGIRPAICGMIVSAAVGLLLAINFGDDMWRNMIPVAIFLASLFTLIQLKKDEVWVIVGAAILGMLLF
ncbi:chromate efflux transporter [Cochlodiniinecator piscidefendens]|uniref:chromate efflux transporter n=1 Tax=Cochlodiniinecator piscidefendens TaxID=2715756 RepID=UPI00140C5ABB|nr:chromate efflux transporter [Cochlodiniinecator piscidefendens]